MSRRRSICFLCAGVLLVLLAVVVFILTDDKENTQPPVQAQYTPEIQSGEGMKDTQTMQEVEPYRYYLAVEENRLNIYDYATKAFLFHSGIQVSDLPCEVQEQLENGIYFADEEALYEFLENYSS